MKREYELVKRIVEGDIPNFYPPDEKSKNKKCFLCEIEGDVPYLAYYFLKDDTLGKVCYHCVQEIKG